METLLQSLASPGDMSGQQWLLVVIMLLIVAGGAWFVLRLYRIIEADRKRRYVPNIGRKRLNMATGDGKETPTATAQAGDAPDGTESRQERPEKSD